MHIERINPDVEFCKLALMKVKKFFSLCILPELLGKWYTQPSTPPTQLHGDEELVDDVDGDEEEGPWCYCQTDIEGSKLIGCDNPRCAIQRVPYTPLENGITLKYWAFHASRVSTKILSRSRENRGGHVSRVNLKKNSRGNVFKFSYLSFAQAVLFGLIDLVFRSHQVV